MSYDYDALLQSILSHRRSAYATNTISFPSLTIAVDEYSTLSSHCPLPPLLWLKYAHDAHLVLTSLLSSDENDENDENNDKMDAENTTANKNDDNDNDDDDDEKNKNIIEALETKCQILEQGLDEYPGSLLLRRSYLDELDNLDTLYKQQQQQQSSSSQTTTPSSDDAKTTKSNLLQTLSTSLDIITTGVYFSSQDDEDMLRIFNVALKHLSSSSSQEKNTIWHRRAKTPCDTMNESLMDDYKSSSSQTEEDEGVVEMMEENRRKASRWNVLLAPLEQSLREAMNNDGILPPTDDIILDEEREVPITQWGMGLGTNVTADAFLKYIQSLNHYDIKQRQQQKRQQKMISDDDDDDDDEGESRRRQQLIMGLYERGIAECPTVEKLWLSYISFLKTTSTTTTTTTSTTNDDLLSSLHSRAIRNCPYSLPIFLSSIRHHASLLLSDDDDNNDDDSLQSIMNDATSNGFLSRESLLELFLEITRCHRRRLLSSSNNNNNKEPLIKLLRESYNNADNYLKSLSSSWNEGRGRLWKERAICEYSIIDELCLFKSEEEMMNKSGKEAQKCFERSVNTFPYDGEAWLYYIDFTSRRELSEDDDDENNDEMNKRWENMRKLYNRGFMIMSAPKSNMMEQHVRDFGNEWIKFEERVGTVDMLEKARNVVKERMNKFLYKRDGKRDREDDNEGNGGDAEQQPVMKKLKTDDNNNNNNNNTIMETTTVDNTTNAKPTNLKKPKSNNTPQHTITIKNLTYPAHPYTIHVHNIPPTTTDMDLVDAFSPYGRIVHARLLRHSPQEKKRRGLIQFEERSPVEHVMTMMNDDDVVMINGAKVTIERSHIPAVSVVPPGKHRVNKKGEGKVSHRNEMMRLQKRKNVEVKKNSGESQEAMDIDVVGDDNKKGVVKKEDTKTDVVKTTTTTTTKANSNDGNKAAAAVSSSSSSAAAILAFRPRNVNRRKKKMVIEKNDGSADDSGKK